MALLPVLLLFGFALLSIIPSLFGATSAPDPRYAFEPTSELSIGRETFSRGIPYFVSPKEWESSAIWQQVPETKRSDVRAGLFSPKLRQFERGVEQVYVRKLQNEVGHGGGPRSAGRKLTTVRVLQCPQAAEDLGHVRLLWNRRGYRRDQQASGGAVAVVRAVEELGATAGVRTVLLGPAVVNVGGK